MLALLVLSLFPSAPAPAAAPAAVAAQEESTPASERARRLEAWRDLDPAARAELKRRFEQMKDLGPEERERLTRKAAALEQRMERTLASLPPKERGAIEALPPRERRRVLRAIVADEARIAATRLRQRLTDEERARLETADAAGRKSILDAVRERTRRSLPGRLARLGKDLGLGPEEMAQLERVSKEDARGALVDLVRRRARQHAREHGLPSNMSAERWEAILGSPDQRFVRAYLRIRRHDPGFGVPPERWERMSRDRREIADRLASLITPTAAERARAPRAPEWVHRRRAALTRRPAIEELLVRRLGLPVELSARIRTLSETDFGPFVRYAIRVLGTDAAPDRALGRWLDRRGERGQGRGEGGGRRGHRRGRGGR